MPLLSVCDGGQAAPAMTRDMRRDDVPAAIRALLRGAGRLRCGGSGLC